MKAFYKFEETTNMESLQMKVSSYGAVLKYGLRCAPSRTFI